MRCIVVVALLVPAVAFADDKPAPTPVHDIANDCAVARKLDKVCVVTFDTEVIEPPPPPPPPVPIAVRRWAYMNSLLRIRRDFHREIIESVEGL